MKSKYKILRLCRDEQTIKNLQQQSKKYNLPEMELVTGIDYFEFLRKIISEVEEDFALVTHDDVYLSFDIEERIEECISKFDAYFGAENWALAGNAGIEYLSNKVVRYLSDPHSKVTPSKSDKPRIVTFIDGNTLLLNLKNLRAKNIDIPKLTGFQFYDFAILAESYLKGLVSAVDSSLYVYHGSKGNQGSFDNFVNGSEAQNYLKSKFINKSIVTLNGIVEIKNNFSHLIPEQGKGEKVDFYMKVEEIVKKSGLYDERKTVNIVVRSRGERINQTARLLDSIAVTMLSQDENTANLKVVLVSSAVENFSKLEELVKQYDNLDMQFTKVEGNSERFNRVHLLEEALKVIPETEFVWVVDDDDFIFPSSIQHLNFLLDKNYVLIGDSAVFREKWNDEDTVPEYSFRIMNKFVKDEYYKTFMGENRVPFPNCIYPIEIIKELFNKFKLRSDYFEDYALLMLAHGLYDLKHYPILLAGISFHGSNSVLEQDRTMWDLSYSTFMSEIVNAGIIKDADSLFAQYVLDTELDKAKYIKYIFNVHVLKRKMRRLKEVVRDRIKRIFTKVDYNISKEDL